ncbi:hypothetical protein JM18_002512 [Phytophthora kernoviae]|uniref:Protein kinase domain-containing protein n=1 Tax=Phytophthora kernoviae TaxID=325452 RepID=A0A922AR60_9STRA|nr:hypothetical protein JM18_002512 [Phytophthora kernoviae]
MLRLTSLILLVAAKGSVNATLEAEEVFSGINCAGTPDVLAMYNVYSICADDGCSAIDFGNGTYCMATVLVQQLISRGGYGEVYYGLFNGQQVAIKMLLPKSRKSVKHVNDFLAEVKLMATMDHPCIVQFVGVAWDSLTDLCVVSEYMEGGDLRALLSSYEAQNYKLGFDRTKVIIALHVAHALTYLHSLNPPVLHRDLKLKNILMSSNLEAKVTDFGISRERVDQTMTAGVGTSLWMAPEMMMGERYDDKADMFSFGVVLSELDQHSLPYSHAKDNNSGRKLPDTAILQMVTLGQIRVEFSSEALESMVQLGMACVSVDPKDRPTAAEALYKLQVILRQELEVSPDEYQTTEA